MGDITVKVLCESVNNPSLIRYTREFSAVRFVSFSDFLSTHIRAPPDTCINLFPVRSLSNGSYSRKFCPSSVLKSASVGRRRKFGSKLKYPAPRRLKYLTSNLSLRDRKKFTLTKYIPSDIAFHKNICHIHQVMRMYTCIRINSRSDCLN